MNNKSINTIAIIVGIVIIFLIVVIYSQQRTIRVLSIKSNSNAVIDDVQLDKQPEIASIGYKYPGKSDKDA